MVFEAVECPIAEMAINGSGIRDTQEDVKVVNYRLLEQLDVETIDVDLYPVESAEMDEMWSFLAVKNSKDGYGMP